MNNFESLLTKCIETGASDLHLKSGESPRFRLYGGLTPIANAQAVSSEDIIQGVESFIEKKKLESLASKGSVDGAFKFKNKRFSIQPLQAIEHYNNISKNALR